MQSEDRFYVELVFDEMPWHVGEVHRTEAYGQIDLEQVHHDVTRYRFFKRHYDAQTKLWSCIFDVSGWFERRQNPISTHEKTKELSDGRPKP